MRRRRHTWQLIVFIGAILLPSAALVMVSRRTMEQNRELAGKRRLDEQRAARQRIARELLERLEMLKSAAAAKPGSISDSEIALVARVEAGRLVLPWEDGSAAPRFRDLMARPAGFASAVARGQRAEFAGADLETAAAGYKEALGLSVNPLQAAHARLLLAGVLQKQHRAAESFAEARQVLAAPVALADEDGVPLAVQAAVLLVRSPADRPAIRNALMLVTGGRTWHPPMTIAALSNLAAQLRQAGNPAGRGWIEEFREKLAASIRLQEQVQAFQDDAPRLGLLTPAAHPVWLYYSGTEPWLVGTQFDGDRPVLVVGVRARDIFRPFEAAGNLRFLASTEPGGELLADSFPGLKVRFAAAEALDPGGAPAGGLYYAALFVLVGGTAFGTSLLWRSLRREMELAETRSQFVASVSHELKTPLTAIRMFAETLQMGRSLESKVRNEYLETISNECDRLSRLVDNVLLFSRIEQGKNVYHFRKIDLGETVRRAAQTLAYQLSQHGFGLRTEVAETLPALHADPDAIEQAVLNLLTNAMKYSGANRRIDLSLGQRDSEAFVRVTDYGMGIAAAELGKIFEKYYRAPGSQSIPGTGLGLTLVAQIAKAHGGRVDVESTPGKGSTFTMWLPLGSEA
jgi:signal transduction histidine kinase